MRRFQPQAKGVLLCAVLTLVAACTTLPDTLPPRPYEAAVEPRDGGTLHAIADSVRRRFGAEQSGFALLDRAEDALRVRLALVDEARHSLDVMYYLWWSDDSGILFLRRLLRAAERGVKVRIIVDDLLLFGEDDSILAIDSHPNVSLVLFNASRDRSLFGRAVEGLFNFRLTNIRMHTKLLVADNRAMIIGGRNIGNEYFGWDAGFNFHDLDVLGIGPVARRGSDFFDQYWNSDWMAPAGLLGAEPTATQRAAYFEDLDREIGQSKLFDHLSPKPTDWSEELRVWVDRMSPGHSRIVYDRLEPGRIARNVLGPKSQMFELATNEILIANAYIIPDQEGIDSLRDLCRRGLSIRILTNSLESQDVPAVNGHYDPWRKPLLETGCLRLHELRADADLHHIADTSPVHSKYLGLHSKVAVVDRRYVFIGSLNFDPRSAGLNVETGILVDSTALGAELARLLQRDMQAERSWEVSIGDDGELLWTSTLGTVDTQPARSYWQRVNSTLFSILPRDYF